MSRAVGRWGGAGSTGALARCLRRPRLNLKSLRGAAPKPNRLREHKGQVREGANLNGRGRPCSPIFVLLCALFSASALSQDPPNKIRWNNSESIPGDLLSATVDDVTWSAPFFSEPLTVRWDVLRRLDMPVASAPVTDAFSFAMRDGSHICGDITAISPQTITIKSARHGEAVLKRNEVLSARRLRGEKLLYGGLSGESGWEYGSTQPTISRMAATSWADAKTNATPSVTPNAASVRSGNLFIVSGEGGAMRIPFWNRPAFLDAKLPSRMDVEFRVSSTQRPDFRVVLQVAGKSSLSLGTWDEEIVLFAGNAFQSVMKIGETDREVALRICWDMEGKKCSVFKPEGELLTEWTVPNGTAETTSGILVGNKGRDLTLKMLRVREWDGKPLMKVNLKQPRVELADGRVLGGSVTSAAADGVSVGAEKIALAQIDAMIFSTDEPGTKEADAHVSWSDGTLIKGRIARIKDGAALIWTNFAALPLLTRTDNLRQIMINLPLKPETPPDQMDKIQFTQNSLRGKLVTADEATPRWLAVGSDKAVSVAPGVSAEISRVFAKDAKLPIAPALLYTRDGDIVAGDMRGIDKGGVEISSEMIEKKQFSADEVRAVQFSAEARLNLTSFEGEGWSVIKGDAKSVKRDKSKLEMQPGAALGHSALMQASEIKFSMVSGGSAALRLRFFCNGADGAKSTSFLVSNWGSHVYAGVESTEGQLAQQFRTNITSGKPAKVKFIIQEKQIEFQLEGSAVTKFSIDAAKKSGAGLILEPASLWGNTPYPITLTDFTATSQPGRTWLPDVSEETKTQALTVPRFRQDDPPRHALIAANGDVLRGEIEAATAKSYAFRSGLENLTVPRDRVKAVVWLQKPEKHAPPPAVKTSAHKALEVTLKRNINYSSTPLSSLTSVLTREVADLKIKLPEKQDTRRFPMRFGGQTVGQALDEICALFGLRYRVDKDGTVVLEPKPALAKNMLPRSFWLANAAFKPAEVVKEKLAAKGAMFPEGATASYDAGAMMLHSVNTKVNHEKLAAVLQSDFGGVLGSPTHWLQLASGARLALSVEKFGAEHITGSSPRLGKCKVPVAEVFGIRDTAPEPGMVMAAVSDWKLVNAPEPVLPESGGESNALLGKDAKDFKLLLLGGGDFELSKHKGKVVVLDFWATWCGPCIKSLPDLIAEMEKFPADKVSFIGVNQAEGGEVVKRFLDTRGWKMTVAMDAVQSVGRQFGVEGIPHTVIIGKDGKVVWVHSGYTPEAAKEAAAAVTKALAAP